MNGTLSGDWSTIVRKPTHNCWEFPGRRQVRCWVGGRLGIQEPRTPPWNYETWTLLIILRFTQIQTIDYIDCIMLHVHLVPVCRHCMELWTMMRKLCGSPARARVAATSSPNTGTGSHHLPCCRSRAWHGHTVPAVLCSHCNQHLSPIDICVTVVLLVSSSCNLLPICCNHLILYWCHSILYFDIIWHGLWELNYRTFWTCKYQQSFFCVNQ